MDTSTHSARFSAYRAAILISLFSLSQLAAQTHRFYPDWSAGTKKTITMSTSQNTYVNEELSESTSSVWTSELQVVSTDDSGPTIETLYKDASLRTALQSIDDLGGELEVEDLRIVNHLDRETGELSLENFEEVAAYYKKTVTHIRDAYQELAPELGQLMEAALSPMEKLYTDESSVKEMMDKEVNFIYLPFTRAWEVGKAYVAESSQANPLSQEGELNITVTSTLRSVDAATGVAVFDQTIEFDMSQMKEMMMNMIVEMSRSMAPEEELTEEKMAELGSLFDMNMDLTQETLFDTRSGWVTSSTITTTVDNMSMGTKARSVSTVSTKVE